MAKRYVANYYYLHQGCPDFLGLNQVNALSLKASKEVVGVKS